MDAADRPIGYWLKQLDRLIDLAFDRCLAEQGLSRRHWQTLSILARDPVGEQDLVEALRPFWGEGAVTPAGVTGDLVTRGWVLRNPDGRFVLTADGEAAHVAVAEQVHALRRRSLDGLTEPEYEATVRVLRRMAENLTG